MEIVDMKYEKFRVTITVEVVNGNCPSLIAPRNPSRYFLPGAPASGDIALCVQLTANSIEPSVRPL
jgi:hypothetical protein